MNNDLIQNPVQKRTATSPRNSRLVSASTPLLRWSALAHCLGASWAVVLMLAQQIKYSLNRNPNWQHRKSNLQRVTK